MPRFPRNFLKTEFIHVMTQGINKSYIFGEPEDIKYYIKLMYELLQDFKIEIIAYCIMNNHAHILMHIGDIAELSKYMQRLNSRYGIFYNKKYRRVGYVFRNRFRSEGIYSEQHFYNCIKYIYDNPVKAGICKRPDDYPFSNYKPIDFAITENYTFIDIDEDKEKLYKDFLFKFLKENDTSLQDLKNNSKFLKELIPILNNDYKLSLRG